MLKAHSCAWRITIIPLDEPELIRDCVSNYQKQSAWYSQVCSETGFFCGSIVPAHSCSREAACRRARLGTEVNLPMNRPTFNPMKKPLRIMKFGGTSVGDASSIRKVVDIIRDASCESDLVVVVSAMSGVTNQLIDAATQSALGDRLSVQRSSISCESGMLRLSTHSSIPPRSEVATGASWTRYFKKANSFANAQCACAN